MDIYFHIFLSRWIACADVATRNTFLMDKSMSGQNVATTRKKLKMLFSESFNPTHPSTSRTNIHVFQPMCIRPALLSQILKKIFLGVILVVSNFENFFGCTPKFLLSQMSDQKVSCWFCFADTQWVVVVYKLRHSFYNLGLTID